MRIDVPLLLLLLSACASKPPLNPAHRAQVGMDKDQVLQSLGNPKYTYRGSGQDHWVYVTYRGTEEVQEYVTFEDGRVVRIHRPTPKHILTQELESAGSLESHRKPLKENASAAGFKTIDGGPDDVNKP